MADAPLLREEDFGFDPAYRVELPMFDGPLDLLLYLIRKHKIDIYDIPISLITEKYLAYIDQMKELDVDVASEFLVMAAELIHIKSRMLLPQIEEPGEEGEDPRAELVRRLLEYQAIKEAAVALADLDLLNRDVFVHPADRSLLPEPEDGGIKEI
ncbi:MAG: segregation/condensation protein A, partial [Bdellovibrionota bacterium]